MDLHDAPSCPADGTRLVSTIAGWRCPICGVAVLRTGRDRARAAHPSAGERRGTDGRRSSPEGERPPGCTRDRGTDTDDGRSARHP